MRHSRSCAYWLSRRRHQHICIMDPHTLLLVALPDRTSAQGSHSLLLHCCYLLLSWPLLSIPLALCTAALAHEHPLT